MDKKQIDNSPPGPCLDRLVATEIMGNRVVDDDIFGSMEMHTDPKGANIYYPLRSYSKNLSNARLVVSKMIRLAYDQEAAYWHAEDRPDVICKAALRAVLRRRKESSALKRRAAFSVVK